MKGTVFNPAQMQLLEMMSFVNSEKALECLKQAISDYFATQAQNEIERLWDSGVLNESTIEGFRHLHERTPYNR